MTVQPIVLYTLTLFIILFGLAIVILLFSYVQLIKKFYMQKQDRESVVAQGQEKVAGILDEARTKAVQIIEDANLKASDSLSKAKFFEEEGEKLLEKEVKDLSLKEKDTIIKASKELLSQYKQLLENLKEQQSTVFSDVSKDIKNGALSEISNFKEVLQKETIEKQKTVDQEIEKEYKEVHGEVEEYKKAQLKKVDDSIYKILITVSKLVLGKSIRLEEHENLVIEALALAKEEESVPKEHE